MILWKWSLILEVSWQRWNGRSGFSFWSHTRPRVWVVSWDSDFTFTGASFSLLPTTLLLRTWERLRVYSSSIYDKKVLWRRPSEWSARSQDLYTHCGESSQAHPIFPINKSPGNEVLPRLFVWVNSRAMTQSQVFLLQNPLAFYWMLAVCLDLSNLGPWACLGLLEGSGRVAVWGYFFYTLCLSKRSC